MSKLLLLLRHGKSDWNASFDHDHQRPLAPRGQRAAAAMGQFVLQAGQVPQGVISSSALRAITTAQLVAADWGVPIAQDDRLYEATVGAVVTVIRQQPAAWASVLLVGHQPTWADLTTYLMGGGAVTVPTATLVGLELAVTDWDQVGPGVGALRWLVPPKLLD